MPTRSTAAPTTCARSSPAPPTTHQPRLLQRQRAGTAGSPTTATRRHRAGGQRGRQRRSRWPRRPRHLHLHQHPPEGHHRAAQGLGRHGRQRRPQDRHHRRRHEVDSELARRSTARPVPTPSTPAPTSCPRSSPTPATTTPPSPASSTTGRAPAGRQQRHPGRHRAGRQRAPRQLHSGPGDDIVCTFTNTLDMARSSCARTCRHRRQRHPEHRHHRRRQRGRHRGALTVDGTTGANTVNSGTFYLSEVDPPAPTTTRPLPASTTRGPSTTTASERHRAGGHPGRQRGRGRPAATDVICTFTNTRQTATIELRKDWVGTRRERQPEDRHHRRGSEVDSVSSPGR